MGTKDYLEEIRKEITYITPFEEEDDSWDSEGYEFLNQGKYKEAEKKFKELIVSQPEHHGGYEGLANVYYAAGDKEKAIWFMEKAVQIARRFLENDSIDIEVINQMEANLQRMKENKALDMWWE